MSEISKMEWEGLKPQRFHGGRVHIRPKDCLGPNYDSSPLETYGRKHFEEKHSDQYDYRPSKKIFQESYKTQINEAVDMKKLVYIPPMKHIKPLKLQFISRQTERERFGRQIGMMTFKMSSPSQTNNQNNLENQTNKYNQNNQNNLNQSQNQLMQGVSRATNRQSKSINKY